MTKNLFFKSSFMFALLVLFCGVVQAQSVSGRPGDATSLDKVTTIKKVVQGQPDGDLTVLPPSSSSSNGISEADAKPVRQVTFEYTPAWQRLQDLTVADQKNAFIQFEQLSVVPPSVQQELKRIESLWNTGNFNQAIRDLHVVEQSKAVKLAVGIGWRVPKKVEAPDWENDKQIETQTASDEVHLDSDPATVNIFAVIRRQEPAGSPRWTANLSTDDGKTWTETFTWGGGNVIATSASIVDDYVYISYVTDVGGTFTEARIRRLFKSDGSVDNVYFFQTWFDKGVDIDEISLSTNKDFFDNRIYCTAMLADGSLIFYWDVASDGLTPTEISTGVTDASHGLDSATNENFTTNFLAASYITTSGRLNTAILTTFNTWIIADLDDAVSETAISAYDNVFITVFENSPGTGQAIKYWISYDEGATWLWNWIADSSGSQIYFRPDVAARRGFGISVIWQEELGEPDPMWYRNRNYPLGSGWSTPEQFNNLDVVTGTPTEIEVMPPRPGYGRAHGASWITDITNRTALFDRNDAAPSALTASMSKISTGTGQKVALNLDAGSGNAGRQYLMLGSVSGTVPGINLPGGFATLPLNWDFFTNLVLSLLNTAVFNNFSGNLDAAGQEMAVFNTLGPQPGAVGLTVYFAFALQNPWSFASNAVALPFIP